MSKKDEIRQQLLMLARKEPAPKLEFQVLRKLRHELSSAAAAEAKTLELLDEQLIVGVWNQLFMDGTLTPGYDLEHPDRPFFHFSVRRSVEEAMDGQTFIG